MIGSFVDEEVFALRFADLMEIDLFMNDESFVSGGITNENPNLIVKLFDLNGTKVNIKAFKTPMIINRLIYGFIRKSKARRSFEYANRLSTLDIKSPTPIAFYEFSNFGFFDAFLFIFKESVALIQSVNLSFLGLIPSISSKFCASILSKIEAFFAAILFR